MGKRAWGSDWRSGVLRVVLLGCLGGVSRVGWSQAATGTPDAPVASPASKPAVDILHESPEERSREAWTTLTEAAGDSKRPETRIQALAALGLLRSGRSSKLIAAAMLDADLDVRTAAILAAAQTKDRNLVGAMRNLLDDKEPQVAFAAATSLWKMNDHSGEDILVAVVDGERSAGPTLVNGTKHTISKDLHDPAMLAKMGALQGATMLLGPFGFGVTAYEYIRKNGGDLARVSAIEQIAQERTEPIHKELLAALGDKDQSVRAAAAKALVEYHDAATSMAIFALFADPKVPVRLTASAAYLRTTGVAGPGAAGAIGSTAAKRP